MDFGGLSAELIDGLVTVAYAFPSDEHGIIIENLGHHLRLALDASNHQHCRPVATSALRIRGLDHGLPHDNDLGPDLTVCCRGDDGVRQPSLIAEVAALQQASDWNGASAMMTGAARRLENAGAEVLVICTNTMHRMAEAVEAAVAIPLVYIADATAPRLKAAGVRRYWRRASRWKRTSARDACGTATASTQSCPTSMGASRSPHHL